MPQLYKLLGTTLLFGSLSYGAIELLPFLTPINPTQNTAVAHTAASSPQAQANRSQITREDFYVESDPEVQIFVREVLPTGDAENLGVPVLFLHGGGAGGVSNYDLNVPGYSLAETFARAGHPVYLMDVRGFGNSTRPASFNQPIESSPPAVPSTEAVRDVSAVVDWIRTRAEVDRVALLGWATGGHWAGMYTSQNNDKVSHLIMLNSLYGVNAPWDYRENFEDPERPGQFDSNAGDRLVTAEGLIANWTEAIPVADVSQWRDPAVAQAYAQTALESDPADNTRTPPSLRIPGEFRREAYNLSLGQKYWEAADITAPTLVIRGERDHWSRPEDVQALNAELPRASRVETLTIADATHFLFLDRPERGRDQFIDAVLSFLANPES